MKKTAFTVLILTVVLSAAVALAQKSPSVGMLGDRHISDFGNTCVDCHDEETPTGNPEKEFCLECHGSYQEIAENTMGEEMNPHDNHYGPVPCGDCHKSHANSILFCDECHSFGNPVP